MKKFLKLEYLTLLLIMLVGSYLRLQAFLTNSFAFTFDVGRDMLALRNIVVMHKIPLIGAIVGGNSASDLPGIFYGPWWYYMLTPFFIIFSGDPRGIALTMSLIGILTILLGFYFGRKIGGNYLGFFFALIASVSSVLISFSSQIWNPNIAPFFVILILLVLNKLFEINKQSKRFLYFILGILLALSMDVQIIFGILLFLGIVLSVVITERKKISIKYIILFILGNLIILAPRILFDLRHQFLMTKALIAFLLKGNSLSSNFNIIEIFNSRFNVFFDQFNSTLALGNKLLGAVLIFFIIATIIILYKKAERQIQLFINTSVMVILVFIFGTVFLSHDIWPHYLVGLPVFYILLFSIAAYLIAKNFSTKLAGIIVILVFLLNLNPYALIQNFNKPIWEGDASVYRNQVAVVDYVYKQAGGKPFKYVVYTPPLYDFTYQYLFNWYGPKKYHYLPQVQSNLAYFIIEPDTQYAWRLKDWLTQREADGKIIKSEVIKGGIIVQTRVH
jgi:4-amino-4-deoxy-L-arabinose transferase-like glycosyltransferase